MSTVKAWPELVQSRELQRHAWRDGVRHDLDIGVTRVTDWLGGWDRISSRSRDSLSQVGRDLCGYPQLASEARFAAGQLGLAARHLLLGTQLPPSWRHVDLDEILTGAAD